MIVIKCPCQIDHKLNTKTESDNIKYVYKILKFTFFTKFASLFQHYKFVDILWQKVYVLWQKVDVLEIDQMEWPNDTFTLIC